MLVASWPFESVLSVLSHRVGLVPSCRVASGHVAAGRVTSRQVRSCQVALVSSRRVKSGHVWSSRVLSGRVASCQVLSRRVGLVESRQVRSGLVSSRWWSIVSGPVGLVASGPIGSSQVASDRVESRRGLLVSSGPVSSSPVTSGQVRHVSLVRSRRVGSRLPARLVGSGLVRSGRVSFLCSRARRFSSAELPQSQLPADLLLDAFLASLQERRRAD